jgi:hypothetical protein
MRWWGQLPRAVGEVDRWERLAVWGHAGRRQWGLGSAWGCRPWAAPGGDGIGWHRSMVARRRRRLARGPSASDDDRQRGHGGWRWGRRGPGADRRWWEGWWAVMAEVGLWRGWCDEFFCYTLRVEVGGIGRKRGVGMNFLNSLSRIRHSSVNWRMYCHLYSLVNRWMHSAFVHRFQVYSLVSVPRNIIQLTCFLVVGGWIGKVPDMRIWFVVSSCSNQLRTGSWNM